MAGNYGPWIKKIAQAGLISKGGVYILFGILILMATFTPTESVGLMTIIKYVINLGWFGRLVVAFLAIGLFCYAAWKYCQMVLNVEGHTKNFYGYFTRTTWLGPFVFYIILGSHAVVQLFNWYFGYFHYYEGQGGELQLFLGTSEGKWIIAFIAITFLANAFTLFYLAGSGKYTLMLTGRAFYQTSPRLARATGFIGYTSYGFSLFITGALFAYSIYFSDDEYANGQQSMFHYLIIQPWGQLLLTIISFGTVCYGIYFLLTAYYRWRLGEAKSSSTSTGK